MNVGKLAQANKKSKGSNKQGTKKERGQGWAHFPLAIVPDDPQYHS